MPTTIAARPDTHRTWLAILLATVLAVTGAVVFTPADRADAAVLPASILDGGYIISDAEFLDGDSMTVAQIQSFLNARVPKCASGATCVKSFKANFPAKKADNYCKAVAAKSGATAADIIARVALACGINPKVILVMLQKEQGLITSTAPTSWAYRAAMGQSCPDTAPCDAAAAGFVNQVYLGARQMQVYLKNPNSFNYKAGQVNTIKWHPTSACGTSKVYIQNKATAALYIYTPYRPNVAALAAGYGTGDSCSTYGNRNFYNYYESWFVPSASPSTGAPAQVPACQQPLAADIAARSGTATVKATSLKARTAPTLVCSSGLVSLKKGAKVTITGAYGAWTRATVNGKTMWLTSSNLTLPTTGAPAGTGCAQPASVTKASGTIVVTTNGLNVRTAPMTTCDTGRITLNSGATAERTGIYGDWWRVTYSGKTYWVHSDYVTVKTPAPAGTATPKPTSPPAAACTVPTTGITKASGTLVAKPSSVTTRTAPSTSCTVGSSKVAYGVAMTRTGTYKDFTRVTVGSKTSWVETIDVVTALEIYTTAEVHLRASASTSSASVELLAKGTAITRLGQFGDWRKVAVGSLTGYVHEDYISAKKPAATPVDACAVPATGITKAGGTYLVKPRTVVARTAPSADCTTGLSRVVYGTGMTRTGTFKDFTRVTVGSKTWWVKTSEVAVAPVVYATQAVHLRAAKSTSSTSLALLAKGTAVTRLGANGDWRKVSVGTRTGYVHEDYLSATKPKAASKATAAASGTQTTTEAVNLRAGASTSTAIIVQLKKNTKVTVTSKSGVWRKVKVGSRTGWVHSAYLK